MTTFQMVIGLLSLREKKQAVGILGLVTFMALLAAGQLSDALLALANPELFIKQKPFGYTTIERIWR